MSPERWERVCDLFDQAFGLPPDRRDELLTAACGDDERLRRDVERLLAWDDRAEAEGFLAPPPSPEPLALSLPDFGDFEQIEYRGHGGMGMVYTAQQKSLKRQVALKFSFPWVDALLFRREAESMARLRHESIVRVLEVGEWDGRPYFSMELIEGESLDLRLGELRDGPPGPRQQRAAAELTRDVARAVHHAHVRGILHRDLKPANILVDTRGRPHVADFGLAVGLRGHDGGEPDGRLAGATPAYAAPEQVHGACEETVRTDVFGLGAILYALLTGHAPRRQGAPDDPTRRPSAFVARLDADLEAICLRCLELEPTARYETADALAADLDRWLAGRETSARPWSRSQRVVRWCRRRPALAILAGAAVVLLVAASLLTALRIRDASQQLERAQRDLAEHKAEALWVRLQQLGEAVERVGATPALAELLARNDRDRVQELVLREGNGRTDLNGESPFDSWFVVDRQGAIVARWKEMLPELEGLDHRGRDYYRGATAQAHGGGVAHAYFSRVYQAERTAGLAKLGISVPLVHQGELVGVVVASVTTGGPTLGLPALPNEPVVTALLARVDPHRMPDDPPLPAGATELLVLRHPAYGKRDLAVFVSPRQADATAAGYVERWHDPVGRIADSYRGAWHAAFAPVRSSVDGRSTDLIVAVQARPARGVAASTWAALAAAAALVLFVLSVSMALRRAVR